MGKRAWTDRTSRAVSTKKENNHMSLVLSFGLFEYFPRQILTRCREEIPSIWYPRSPNVALIYVNDSFKWPEGRRGDVQQTKMKKYSVLNYLKHKTYNSQCARLILSLVAGSSLFHSSAHHPFLCCSSHTIAQNDRMVRVTIWKKQKW